MRNYFTKRFLTNRGEFPINTEIDGGAIDFPNRNDLANSLQVSPNQIKNYTIIGNDVRCHMVDNYKLRSFSKRHNQLGADTITAYRDLSGKVTSVGNFTFSQSIIEELVLNEIVSIRGGGLRDLHYCTKFHAPKLRNVGQFGLYGLGYNTTGLDEGVDFIVDEFENMERIAVGDSPIRFNRQFPLVTNGVCTLTGNSVNTLASVFPNKSGLMKYNYNDCNAMLGHDYPDITSMEGYNTFKSNYNATYIRLPNLETIVYNNNGGRRRTFWDCTSLTELDIRKCNNWTDYVNNRLGDPLSSPDYQIVNSNNANLTVHAHIDLKTSGNWSSVVGTNVHSSLQKVIDDGGTVNWYNADGTFNSTNNNP